MEGGQFGNLRETKSAVREYETAGKTNANSATAPSRALDHVLDVIGQLREQASAIADNTRNNAERIMGSLPEKEAPGVPTRSGNCHLDYLSNSLDELRGLLNLIAQQTDRFNKL